MEKYYKFAGVEVAVSVPEQWMYEEERTLRPFQVEQVENPHKFYFEKMEKLDAPVGKQLADFPDYRVYGDEKKWVRYIGAVQNGWESAYIRSFHREKEHHVQIKSSEYLAKLGVKTVLNALETEHLVIEAGGIILHASYIEYNKKAILFTAPSETGKSTQADLWSKYRNASIINGDRAVVRLLDGNVIAEGIPFSGSSHFCENRTLPLAAIVYLQQAPLTDIQKITGSVAFRSIWEGCTVNTWNKNDLIKAIDLVQKISSRVPVYQLSCTPDESAVIALENELRKV